MSGYSSTKRHATNHALPPLRHWTVSLINETNITNSVIKPLAAHGPTSGDWTNKNQLSRIRNDDGINAKLCPSARKNSCRWDRIYGTTGHVSTQPDPELLFPVLCDDSFHEKDHVYYSGIIKADSGVILKRASEFIKPLYSPVSLYLSRNMTPFWPLNGLEPYIFTQSVKYV